MIVLVSPGKKVTRTVPKRTLRCWRRAGTPQPENRPEGHTIGLESINSLFKELAIMDTDRKLGEVAANLDDMSDSIEELKDAAHEADSPSEGALDDLQQDVKDASDAIDEVVDPEGPHKS